MKRIACLLAALLLIAAGASAQEKDASTIVRTALCDAPYAQASVLMEYYPGVRVEVLREADGQYVQVNVGQPGGSLTGYMRSEDLVFGEENVRENRPGEFTYLQTGWTLYSYCDKLSDVLVEKSDVYFNVMGENDEWFHVVYGSGTQEATGFICRKDIPGYGSLQSSVGSVSRILTHAVGDEPTAEDAIAYAKWRMVEDGIMCNAMDGEIVTLEQLESCTVEVEMNYTYGGEPSPLWYGVVFYYSDRTWEDGSAMICALACLYVEGDSFIAYDYGKG